MQAEMNTSSGNKTLVHMLLTNYTGHGKTHWTTDEGKLFDIRIYIGIYTGDFCDIICDNIKMKLLFKCHCLNKLPLWLKC